MKTNWKSVVEKQIKQVYRWPDGWDTREAVAEQLECSPDRVSQHLAPCIRAGEIEGQSFPVWDDVLKRVVRVTGYRKRPAKEAAPAAAAAVALPDAKAAILRIAARHPRAAASDIQKLLPRKFRGMVTRDDIRRVLG
jgi:hypothetical protein